MSTQSRPVNVTKGKQGFQETAKVAATSPAGLGTSALGDIDEATDDEISRVENVHRYPSTLSEAKAALRNVRGEPGGAVREVWISDRVQSRFAEGLEVHGPKDGRPLIVHVGSGFNTIKVRSGNVVVQQLSQQGNPVEAHGDSNVFVTTGSGMKSSVSAYDNSRVLVDHTGSGVRGSAYVRDDAEVEVWDEEYETSVGSRNIHDPRYIADEAQRDDAASQQKIRWNGSAPAFLKQYRDALREMSS